MTELQINKGVELMLRRRTKEPQPEWSGIKIHKTLILLKKVFQFKIEFIWREEDLTQQE